MSLCLLLTTYSGIKLLLPHIVVSLLTASNLISFRVVSYISNTNKYAQQKEA
jgi:hypothetical protein